MDKDLYPQILKNGLLNTIQYHGLNSSNIIFWQNNILKHKCKKVKEWLEEQEFKIMVYLHSLLT